MTRHEHMVKAVESAFERAAEAGRVQQQYERNPLNLSPPMGVEHAEQAAEYAMSDWREYLAETAPAALKAKPSRAVTPPEGLRLGDLYREFVAHQEAVGR